MRVAEPACIEAELRPDFPPGAVVIHGAARGADRIAGEIAAALGLEVVSYPARWREHGRAAGPIRNRQMLEEGKPDRVIAFWDGRSKGTAHMVNLAKAAGLPVKIVGS